MVIGTFTRFCWKCKQNRSAFGGRLDKRKLWRCATCIEKMTNIWKKGPPPSIGWWPTKHYKQILVADYRWWNGEFWSWAAFAHESADKAARWAAKRETMHMDNIEWADRPADWPERSKT
jgi:hypothetical protein